MVTINLWHLIAICAVATLANGLVGYAAGLKIGYMRGLMAGVKIAAAPKLAGEANAQDSD